jgi:hypothetical protein
MVSPSPGVARQQPPNSCWIRLPIWFRGCDCNTRRLRISGLAFFRPATARDEYLTQKIGTLNTSRPDIWNFIDFLYFSTISQTTIGYGDILPNSRIVRTLVMVQVLVGLFVVGIIINISVGRG